MTTHPVLVLHGPNLNLLGSREPEVYGRLRLAEIDERLLSFGETIGLAVRTAQHNGEGQLVDALHESMGWAVGVVLNPGGYTHTSVTLRDAGAGIGIPVVEVHLSNILAREPFRKQDMIAPVCAGAIFGFGWRSYTLGLQALRDILGN